jgi:hypothetical protein
MKETVPQKPMDPVLHGFLLRESKPVSTSKILTFLKCFPEKLKSEKQKLKGLI